MEELKEFRVSNANILTNGKCIVYGNYADLGVGDRIAVVFEDDSSRVALVATRVVGGALVYLEG